MTQRCAPADTARVGLHYIVHISAATGEPNEDPRIARWDGERWNEVWLYSQPRLVWEDGYRYLYPVPTPAEIEALVRSARKLASPCAALLDDPPPLCARCGMGDGDDCKDEDGYIAKEDLDAVLLPFQDIPND